MTTPTERTDNQGMSDELVRLTRVKAHVSHSATGKLEQVREHMDSRTAAAEKAATGISAGKGVFNGPARAATVTTDDRGKPRAMGGYGTNDLRSLLKTDHIQKNPERGAAIEAELRARGLAKSDKGTWSKAAPVAPARSRPSIKGLGHDGARIAAAGHPGATLEEARKAGASSLKTPLTDEEYAAHTKHIEQTLTENVHKATDRVHGMGSTPDERAANAEKGLYTPERAAIHKQIVNEVYNRQAATAKSEGKAIISGGLGGAGKSTVLKHHPDIDPKHYITANPDDMKEELAKRGLIPKAGNLSPMERSGLVHEESSHMANLLAKRAYADKKNIIHDITMSSTKSTQRRIDELHNHGYNHTKGLFVDIPVETSVSRALGRHRRGLEAHRNGHGDGGRYVPPTIIRANKSSKSSSANRDVFEGLKHKFDSWEVHDSSSDSGARKVASSEDRVEDRTSAEKKRKAA